jgi:GNAT superfamily N-acetyltransferase
MALHQFSLDDRTLNNAELHAAALVATRAFFDDPFYQFLAGGRLDILERGLTLFFEANLRHLGKGGQILTVRDEHDVIVAVAAWLRPGGYPQSLPTQLAQLPGVFRALYRRPRALLDGNAFLQAIAKHHVKVPHWYLFLLVTDPDVQRSGAGTMLMEWGLERMRDEGVGGYLETQKEENLAYYQRFGYQLREELRPVKNGPPLFTMWREAN